VVDAAVGGDLPEDRADLARLLVGHDQRDAAADGLGGRVAVEALGGRVPGADRPVEILREDRIVRRGDDGRQLA
jgi:hypothetical protein